MNKQFRSCVGLVTCIVLGACGGSSEKAPTRTSFGVADDASVANSVIGDGQSLQYSGTEQSATQRDLVIDTVLVTSSADTTTGIRFEFNVSDATGNEIPLSGLSVALEVASGGSFADSYSVPVYDLQVQDNGDVQGEPYSMTARSIGIDLPGGNYNARLVVNPNWQYAFDVVPDGMGVEPYRYLEESDYLNNASEIFDITIESDTICSEDGFENNDGVADATLIPVGGQVNASLCLDNIDLYSVVLEGGQSAPIVFDYTDVEHNPNPTTRYVVLNPTLDVVISTTVAREANGIVINAVEPGQYYLALFGGRSSYRLTRINAGDSFTIDQGIDQLFHPQTIAGPVSWMYGDVTLHRLGLTEAVLKEQVVNCGRITTQFNDGIPVAYVTPGHFADVHEFRFLANHAYLIDGERESGWHITDGDISNPDWYENGFAGYAEVLNGHTWRYWARDGLAYVECEMAINQ